MAKSQPAYIVIAEFHVPASNRREFLDICLHDAEQSVEVEPGCFSFDVNTSDETPETVLLYEAYTDRAAFDNHLTMPHYAPFAEALTRLEVQRVQVRFLKRE